MQALTVTDIADFLQMVETAFADPLFFAFCAMILFAIMYHIKCLLVDGL
jgi:hypothetical protein